MDNSIKAGELRGSRRFLSLGYSRRRRVKNANSVVAEA